MAKADPVGTINERADGAVWAKDATAGWKQIRDGNRQGRAAPGLQVAAAGSGGQAVDTVGLENPWGKHQKRYDLDGHLPDPTIHPSHVTTDTEGDIDTKPVLSWTAADGRPSRSYTMAFHRHRAMSTRESIQKVGTAAFRTAHAKLKTQMMTDESPKARDAAAVGLMHLVGGHRVPDLLGMHAMHVATTLPHQGGEALDSGEPDTDDTAKVQVQKSATSDDTHEHRVHLMLQHPHGHLYPSSHYDEGLAAHLKQRVVERAGAAHLFECEHADVRSALDNAGLSGVDDRTIRHHAAMHMAADKLSKLPKADLENDYATGIAQVHQNLSQVSDEIGEHFGHDPAPAGMSYVPPTLAAAYVEESGGAKHWPKAFRAAQQPEEVEKSCNSAIEVTVSASELSPTISDPSDKASTPTLTTSPLPEKTPTRSPPLFLTEVLETLQPVQVSQAGLPPETVEADAQLRAGLHKMLGTQEPSPRKTLHKAVAEKALGRGLARVRSGEMKVDILSKAHDAYKAGDYKGCYQLLHVSKAAGAGSAGSTGSTSAPRKQAAGAGGSHPGPEGLPIGSETTLGDGTREQKVGPHEWRRLSGGGHTELKKPAIKDDSGKESNPTLDAAKAELRRLRARRMHAVSPDLRHELDQQISALRTRVLKLQKSFGKHSAAAADSARSKQGQSASKPDRTERDTTTSDDASTSKRELAKSVRATAALVASRPVGMVPWYSSFEHAQVQAFDDFVAARDSVHEVLVDLAKAAPGLLIRARDIASQGDKALEQYIAVRVGGR